MVFDRSSAPHVLIILVVYIVCFGAYCFVNLPFWDDWVISQYGVAGLWELFKQVGRREHYFLTAPFVAIGNPMIWAVASFVCWGVVSLALYAILQRVGWARSHAFWAAVLTAAAPLNQARFGLAMTPYAFSAAFFAIGILILVVSVRRQLPWLRVGAVLLIVASFSTNSFLTMSWLAPGAVFLAARAMDPEKRFLPALRVALRHAELFILPVAYWVSKSVFQPTYGLYANYNKFQMGPIQGLKTTIRELWQQKPNWATFFPTSGHLIEAAILAAIVILALAGFAKLSRAELAIKSGGRVGAWLLVGALIVAAISALFPYVMVGISPSYHGLWETRHQTTLAVVTGMLAFAVIRAVLPTRLVPAGCVAILCCFIAMDISASRQLLADVYENNAIIHSPAVAAIPPGTMVGIFEHDADYRMFRRHFQFYDASSMLNAQSAKKAIVAVSSFEVVDPATGAYVTPGSAAFPDAVAGICATAVGRPQYGFGDFVSNGQFAEVTFQPKSAPPTYLQGWGIALRFLFDRQGVLAQAIDNLEVGVVTRSLSERVCSGPCCSGAQTKPTPGTGSAE